MPAGQNLITFAFLRSRLTATRRLCVYYGGCCFGTQESDERNPEAIVPVRFNASEERLVGIEEGLQITDAGDSSPK